MNQRNGQSAAADSNIPIVDFAEWASGSTVQRKQIASNFVEACRTVGFAYIINHGVAPGRVEEAFAMSQKLFDLGHEQKMLAPHPPGGAVHRGYSWPGLEKVTQTFGDEADREDLKKNLRSIADVKVGCFRNPHCCDLNRGRKATRLVVRTIQTNLIFGCPMTFSLDSGASRPNFTGR